MSYSTISRNAADIPFQERVTAACAQEGATEDPQVVMNGMILVGRHRVRHRASAYESAIIGDNPNPGGDESVITTTR